MDRSAWSDAVWLNNLTMITILEGGKKENYSVYLFGTMWIFFVLQNMPLSNLFKDYMHITIHTLANERDCNYQIGMENQSD